MTGRKARKAAGTPEHRPSARKLRAAEAAKQRTVEVTAAFGQVRLSFNQAAVVSHLREQLRLPEPMATAIVEIAAHEFQTRMRETLPGNVDLELERAVAAAKSVVADANLGDSEITAETWPNLLRTLPSARALKRSELNPLMGALRRIVASEAKANLPMKIGRPLRDEESCVGYFHSVSELTEQNRRNRVRSPAAAARHTLEAHDVSEETERLRWRRGKAICASRGCHPNLHSPKG